MEIQTVDIQFLDTEEVIQVYFVESNDGLILMDCGPFAFLPKLIEGLRTKGYALKDVRHLLLTHIHFDHAGAAWELAKNGTQVYVHPFGYKHLLDPSKLVASATQIYQSDMDRLWGKIEAIQSAQLNAVDDRTILRLGGVEAKAYYTPGHARHHIAWQITDQLFCGDVCGIKIGDGPVFPPCPPPDINIEVWHQSIDLISELIQNKLVSKLWLTHAGGHDKGLYLCTKLKEELDEWAQWFEHRYQRTDTQTLSTEFDAWVEQKYTKHQLSKKAMKQYELANPHFMSVMGLTRYWKKRKSL